MNIKKISTGLYVSGQISPTDLPVIAAQGIRSIVSNRPDGEAPTQPSSAELAEAAREFGLEFCHIPVVSRTLTDDVADEFDLVLQELQGPVLAYCRSGTRSVYLWALGQAKTQDVDTLIRMAANAGYDLSGLQPRLRLRSAASDSES